MARRKKSSVSREETGAEPILKRPDGFYWQGKSGEVRGPFVTRGEAEADRLAGGSTEGEFDAGESLQEAESEIGVSEWIDPDTGGDRRGQVPPPRNHLKNF